MGTIEHPPGACPACGLSLAHPTGGATIVECPGCRASFVAAGASRISLSTRHRSGDPDDMPEMVTLPGEFLERFQLGRILGQGGMGMVVLATDLNRQETVAVKVLSRPGETSVRERFCREGRLLSRTAHPNVVRVLEAGLLGEHPYLVTEYLSGGTLKARLAAGRLTLAQALSVALDILAGLEHCHGMGVVHRDLKPENVLFDAGGCAKLVDLGIAKDYSDKKDLTLAGTFLGTPQYMSPEQVRGEPACIASDLYSMGLILFEMVAGRFPFENTSPAAVLVAHLETTPAALSTVVPDVPSALDELVGRALAKRIADRPSSASDMAVAIRRVVERRDDRAAEAALRANARPPGPTVVPERTQSPASPRGHAPPDAPGLAKTRVAGSDRPHGETQGPGRGRARRALLRQFVAGIAAMLVVLGVAWAVVLWRAPGLSVLSAQIVSLEHEIGLASIQLRMITDRPAFVWVEYRPSDRQGPVRTHFPPLAPDTVHRITLRNLMQGTSYRLRFFLAVGARVMPPWTGQSITLRTGQPITVSNLRITPGLANATVSWTTSCRTDTVVSYGPTRECTRVSTNFAQRSAFEHRVVLGPLVSGETYHLRIEARDSDGKAPSVSHPAGTFRTKQTSFPQGFRK